MSDQPLALPLKRFLLVERCPAEWKQFDLYLFRDAAVTFYVGQSESAFARVWEHLIGGFKGHSIVGRFVWCNWPQSMNFTIMLLSSQSAQFTSLGNDLSAAERLLIRQAAPCFNVSQNSQPAPLPASYLPPNARLRFRRGLRSLIYEAELAVKREERQGWIQELG